MQIISQNGNRQVEFNGTLHTSPMYTEGSISAINLLHEGTGIGRFSSVAEAISEIEKISSCREEVYRVSSLPQ